MNYKQAFALGLIAPGTVGREPVAWLYNGVRLPKIPSVAGYEYNAVLVDSGTYYAIARTSAISAQSDSGLYTSVVTPSYKMQDGGWVSYVPFVPAVIIWANHDVIATNGTDVFLSASDPIPVYE